MGILTETALAARPTKAYSCLFREWQDSLDDEDKKTVEDILADSAWNGAATFRFFRANGCGSGERTIRLHKSGDCPCQNKA